MPNEQRHRVICDLTQDEYELQRQLADNDLKRYSPLLEMVNERGVPFNESHIGRIAADALSCATGHEASDEAQGQAEQTADAWPMGKKVQFMEFAAQHWSPPYADETSYWNSTPQNAHKLLTAHPELSAILSGKVTESDLRTKARQAAKTMEEMDELRFQSPEWSRHWNALLQTLREMAEPSNHRG